MTDLGMHRIGEINRRRLGGKRHNLAFRREHVDFGGTQVFLQRAQEFVGIRSFTRPVGKLLNPLEIIGLAQLLILATLTIGLIR